MARVLVIDPDNESRQIIKALCERLGIYVEGVANAQDAANELALRIPDLTIAALGSFDDDVVSLLEQFEFTAHHQLLLLCDTPTVALAKAGMRLGALELFAKPINRPQLSELLSATLLTQASVNKEGVQVHRFGDLVCTSPEMVNVFSTVSTVKASGAALLLVGESGLGKESIAQSLCPNDQELQIVSCAMLAQGPSGADASPLMLGDDQFIFLDNILELGPVGQAYLSHFLAERDVQNAAHIVCACPEDPLPHVQNGSFPQDLYYQLAQVVIHIPPLRERPADLKVAVDHCLEKLNAENSTNKEFDNLAVDALIKHDWPGNVRELENTVFHAFILAEDVLTVDHLPQSILGPNRVVTERPVIEVHVGDSLAEVEKVLIMATMGHYDNDKQMTAKVLGFSLRTLYNKLNQYGLS